MCQFFSFVTDPVGHPAEYYHFDWEYRKAHLDDDGVDSHSHICAHFALDEDRCNKYEFNPLTKMFTVNQINSKRDDSEAAEKWANRLDIKTVVEPLIVKPIVNPLELPKVSEPTDEQVDWLKEWSSVRSSAGDSVGAPVGASVFDSVGATAGNSVRHSVWASVFDSVGASVGASFWAYFSTFFDVEYKVDYSSAIKLWKSGLVPLFDGTTWRLHSGKNADVVFEWKPEGEK